MPVRRSESPIRAAALALIATLAATATRAADPADALLDRVPPDATLALVVEDLGGHLRALAESRLGAGLARSRLVREWLDSDEGAKLRRARRDVEAALGAPLDRVADGLLGRAVVLSLHLPDGEAPGMARGLLQSVVADRDLLDRFIAVANATELGSGALVRVVDREHGGASYSVRDFGDGRPDEAYALLDDGTFVWTNAERLLIDVIDRAADPSRPSLTDGPAIGRVRRALPDRAIARLFVDPKFVARLAASDPQAPDLDELPPPVAAYLDAIDALGAALEWRDGPVLHVVEALDPSRLPGPFRSWAARGGDAGPLLPLIPPSTLLAAAGHVDASSLHDLIVASIPEGDRERFETLAVAVGGVLLGRDPRAEVLPAIDPGMVAWIEPPPADRPFRDAPAVLVASVGDPAVAGAIENALRTVLAFVSLDEGNRRSLRLTIRGGDEARVTALIAGDGPGTTRVAFAVSRGLIVVGTDAEAVASVLSDRSANDPGRRPAALVARDRLFPDASTFAYLDLSAFLRLASGRRDELTRFLDANRGDDGNPGARDDLDRLINLLSPFRAAYATSTLADDASIAHRRIGLIVSEAEDR